MDTELRLISFPGTGNLPLFAGREKGFFARHGVAVALETTPSSMYQAAKLIEGEFQLACTAVDNVIAYDEGAGEADIDGEADLFIVMGATQIEVSFVVAPEIETYADLKGKTLALDAISTGFAFALYRMLENAGLEPGDPAMVSVGATPNRWQALQDGDHAGTLLIEPFTGMARAAGFRVLGSTLDTFAHYPGQVYTASRAWAAENGAALTGFIRGYLDALEWVLNPANGDAAGDILARNMPAMKPQAIAPSLKKLLDPRTGLVPGAIVDRAGLDTVLELRSQYSTQGKTLDDPEKYLDLSYFDAARPGRD